MNFDDLKDQLKSEWAQFHERLQDSSLYNQLKDRFEGLSSIGQKLVMLAGALLLLVMMIFTPLTTYWDSQDVVTNFEDRRSLIKDLFRNQQDSQNQAQLPIPPPLNAIANQVSGLLKSAQLLDTQIKIINTTTDVPAGMMSQQIIGNVIVALIKLNLRQIIDIGSQIQAISSSIKMTDLIIEANKEDARYFDVTYQVTSLNVPEVKVIADLDIPPPPPPSKEEN